MQSRLIAEYPAVVNPNGEIARSSQSVRSSSSQRLNGSRGTALASPAVITLLRGGHVDAQIWTHRTSSGGLVVTCYAETGVVEGFATHWRLFFKNESRRLRRTLAGRQKLWAEVKENLDVIQRALEAAEAAHARGSAVMSGVRQQLFRAFSLPVPVRNFMVVDEEPYLVPLLETLHRERRFLTVLTDTHHARVYSVGLNVATPIAEIGADIPKHHRAAGETWGKQQATIARHREDRIRHYEDRVVQEMERSWNEEHYEGLILLGQKDVLAELRSRLPSWLESKVAAEMPHAFAGRQLSMTAKVRRVLDEMLRAHDARLVGDLKTRFEEHRGVASGPQAVLDALRRGQVGYPGYVLLQSDAGQPASRCTKCESPFAVTHERCPFCGAACETLSLWQEILSVAHRHGVRIHFVGDNPLLAQCGGVAAVLARDEPWPAAPAVPTREPSRVPA